MVTRSMQACLAGALLAAVAPTMAHASSFGDALSKCLVDHSSQADQTLLVQWVFSAISAGPAVKALSSITPAQREDFNRRTSMYFNRVLTVDCRPQAIEAIKYDGVSTIEASFGTLGSVAMRGLMSDPLVQKELQQLGKFADSTALGALIGDAGTPKAAPPAK
jgi:hypothetical protein